MRPPHNVSERIAEKIDHHAEPPMLSALRVLDLTDSRGEIAGMILGDLGADVIRVEPPGGSAARLRGPMLDEAPEHERSLQFFAYNRNKRSIVLDLASASERGLLERLVEANLLRVETRAGHGAATPTSKQIDAATDRLAFLDWALHGDGT